MSFLLAHRPLLYALVALAILCVLAFLRLRSPRGYRAAAHDADAGRRVREHAAAATRHDEPRESYPPIRPAAAWGGGAAAPAGTKLQAEITQLDARLDELAKTFGSGLEGVNRRLEGIARQLELVLDPSGGGGSRRRNDDTRFDASTIGWNDAASPGVETVVSHPVGRPASSSGPGLDVPAGDRVPVEIQGSEVALTHTIPPDAWLVAQGGGRASVWLNAEVEHNRYALDRFALFFDLGDRREGAYATRTPADVQWDEGGQRGRLRTAGTAVPR